MKVTNCKQCREKIRREEQEAFLKKQYAILKDAALTFASFATTAALTAQVRRGRSKEYIQKLFDDMVAIYDTSELFGKTISMTDLMQSLETEYDIDFSRIKVHLETESEFVKGVKNNGNN